jgi:hypothetical protein
MPHCGNNSLDRSKSAGRSTVISRNVTPASQRIVAISTAFV